MRRAAKQGKEVLRELSYISTALVFNTTITSSAPFASEQDIAEGSKGMTEIGEGELSRTLISSDADVSVALSGYVVAAA